jgi:hypothetical protein
VQSLGRDVRRLTTPEPHPDGENDNVTRDSRPNVDARRLADIGEAMLRLTREVQRLRDQYRDLEPAPGQPVAQRVARSDGEMYARMQHRICRVNR